MARGWRLWRTRFLSPALVSRACYIRLRRQASQELYTGQGLGAEWCLRVIVTLQNSKASFCVHDRTLERIPTRCSQEYTMETQ
ncbi:hypothetical protein LX36DRAFT_388614 [Colletotrichum falcatum]|nr:hypothetical protein LX36DRAFT_388614 [Colletotrichum falcatum]